jgi:hypothetical protein
VNVEYFNNLGNFITNDETCTSEIKYRVFTTKVAFNKKKTLFSSKQDFRKKPGKRYI